MIKENIKSNILKKLKEELEEITSASQATKDYSQSDDLKSEGKYDTRAIEAKYLAEAQLKRVDELKSEIHILESFEFQPSSTIITGSLIECEEEKFLILPTSGQGKIDGIQTLSIRTELAQEFIGLEEDESIEHPTTGKELLITKII